MIASSNAHTSRAQSSFAFFFPYTLLTAAAGLCRPVLGGKVAVQSKNADPEISGLVGVTSYAGGGKPSLCDIAGTRLENVGASVDAAAVGVATIGAAALDAAATTGSAWAGCPLEGLRVGAGKCSGFPLGFLMTEPSVASCPILMRYSTAAFEAAVRAVFLFLYLSCGNPKVLVTGSGLAGMAIDTVAPKRRSDPSGGYSV